MRFSKRSIGICLSLALFFCLLPSRALAAAAPGAAVLKGTSSDFLSGYYITYEINGVEYRSDRMGSAFNLSAWKSMSPSDRKSALHVYAFAPDVRREQFGENGSAEMTAYINAEQGWTALWAAYADRIEEQQCGPLKEYYSAENYDAVLAELTSRPSGGNYEQMVSRYSKEPEARDVIERYNLISGLMSTGRSAYNCIVKCYEKAREASVKAISKELISIIVDKALTPNITVAPTQATTAIVTGVFDLFSAVTGFSDSITSKVVGQAQGGMDAVEVIYAMRELAMKNYALANHCYVKAKELSGAIESDAESAIKAIEARKDTAEFDRAEEKAAQREAAESQAYSETVNTPRLESEYNGIMGGMPVFSYDKDAGYSEDYWRDLFSSYRPRAIDYIESRKPVFKAAYDSLRSDYLEWRSKYEDAYDSIYTKYGFKDYGYGLVFPWPFSEKYQPTEPGWVYYSYVDFDDETLADYLADCENLKSSWREAKTTAEQLMNEVRQTVDEAMAEYKVLLARYRALQACSRVSYVDSYYYGSMTYASITVYDGPWEALGTAEEESGIALIDRIRALDLAIDESTQVSIDNTIATIDSMTEEMLSMRSEKLAYIQEQIDEYKSCLADFDLAAQYALQMRDHRLGILDGMPAYVSELRGELVQSRSNELGTFYSVSYNPSYSNVKSNCDDALISMIDGSSNPMATVRGLGKDLCVKYDEFNKYTRRMQSGLNAAEYYWWKASSIYSVVWPYFSGYGLSTAGTTSENGDYYTLREAVQAPMTKEQVHNQAALQLLSADLSGWSRQETAVASKLTELQTRKGGYVSMLSAGSEASNSSLISELRSSVQTVSREYPVHTFSGYARDVSVSKGVDTGSSDLVQKCYDLIDWLETYGSSCSLPEGIVKTSENIEEEYDLILSGPSDTGKLTAMVQPPDAWDTGVVWESLDPAVATVDPDGNITAVSEGTAVITARAAGAPAQEVHADPDDPNSAVVGYTYPPEYTVRFTVKVDAAAYLKSSAAGSEDYSWRNYGTDSRPRFIKVQTENGVTTVKANFRAKADGKLLCMSLYDSEGRLLKLVSLLNDGENTLLSVSTDKAPASVKLFLLEGDLTPCSEPPICEDV